MQALDVVEGTCVPHKYYKIKNVLTNRWVKVYNGLYNLVTGVWKKYKDPCGSQKYKYTKKYDNE